MNSYSDYIKEGNDYLYKKDYDNAISSYEKAIGVNSKGYEAYCNMGSAYDDKKDYDNAISSYEKAIEINPEDDESYYNRGNAYSKKEDYDNAISSYEKAIEINPENDESYYNMGISYDNKEDYDNAIYSFKKAIEINPKNIYKEALDYIQSKIKFDKKRKERESELDSQADMFGGKKISERIETEKDELKKVSWYIIGLTLAITTIFAGIMIAIINKLGFNDSLGWPLVQSNFIALFILSPIMWSLSSLYKRKNILHLSIHDLQDKHYLISTFVYLDKEAREKHTEKMLDIMSENSTAKLLSKLYSSKVDHIYPTAILDNVSKMGKTK